MAEKWNCPSKDILQDWVTACLKVTNKLSDWELQFVLSIDGQLKYKDELSRDQVKHLEEIYAEKT